MVEITEFEKKLIETIRAMKAIARNNLNAERDSIIHSIEMVINDKEERMRTTITVEYLGRYEK